MSDGGDCGGHGGNCGHHGHGDGHNGGGFFYDGTGGGDGKPLTKKQVLVIASVIGLVLGAVVLYRKFQERHPDQESLPQR